MGRDPRAYLDNAIVWRVIQENLPTLIAALERLLALPDTSP